MDIKLDTGEIVVGAIPVTNTAELQTANRIFYELGYYTLSKSWIHLGTFKEIKDISTFIAGDKYLQDKWYMQHHNFHYI